MNTNYSIVGSTKADDLLESSNGTEWKQTAYKIICPTLLLLCALAFVFNVLVLSVFVRRFQLLDLKPTLQLAFSLAASDTWTSLVVGASILYNTYLPIVFGIPSNACMSITMEVFRTGGLLTGTFHLLAIAVHHSASVYSPVRYQQSLRHRRWCTTVVAFITLWLLPPMALTVYSVSLDDQGYSSTNCKNQQLYHSRDFRISISGLILLIFCVICLLYAYLLRHMWIQSRKFQPILSQQRSIRREFTLLKTTLLICGTFFIGWCPACVYFALTCVGCPYDANFGRADARTAPLILAVGVLQLSFIMIKSIVNPIVYTVRIPEIKTEVTQMITTIGKMCAKNNNAAERGNYRAVPVPINSPIAENRL